MSADLQWLLVKDQNSFLVKRNSGRVQFSREAGNLKNLNSFKYSGLANLKTVDVVAKGTGAQVVVKGRANKSRPAKNIKAAGLNRDFRRAARSVRGATKGYRADLTEAALARLTKVHRALAATKKGVQYKIRTNHAKK
eukprot:TRINITY_DN1804_c0_g1_i1.p3 TRINITY_DN1804_c0_g1~~TRINITY_DN1804_c0_g1_i1.p3  ORF type:complete len:138 (+),score=61.71 TRINITY_DN1804_c0_g1_i1:55-468(+)